MPSDRLRASLLQSYDSAEERDLIRALLEMHVADTDLWKAFDSKGLKAALKDPKRESDLRKPVKNYLKDEWGLDRIAAEVPLPSKSSHSASKADIVGFKKRLLGARQAYAVELKSEISRGAVRQAFAQAKEYQRHCEYSTACISPLLYMNFIEELDHELTHNEYEGVGVWVGNSDRVLVELRKPSINQIQNEDRDPMFDWIATHEY